MIREAWPRWGPALRASLHAKCVGWLDAEDRGSRDAVAVAIVALAVRALALRVRPTG